MKRNRIISILQIGLVIIAVMSGMTLMLKFTIAGLIGSIAFLIAAYSLRQWRVKDEEIT